MLEVCYQIIVNMLTFSKGKFVCAGFVATIFYAVGNNGEMVVVLFFLIILDALMALIVVAKTDLRFSSAKASRTLYKMGIYSILVISAHQIDKIANIPSVPVIGDAPVVWLVLVWASATQFLSILEHAAEIGFRIPHKLFSQIKKMSE